MNEHCWILVGENTGDLWWAKRVKPTEGMPCAVQFDPYYVLNRDEKHKDVVGFYHTHPGMTAHYSQRDHRTMLTWVTCLGKPLVCCIQGTDGLRAWWYENDEDPPTEFQAKAMRGIVFGATPYDIIVDSEELPLDGPSDICVHCGKDMDECKCA